MVRDTRGMTAVPVTALLIAILAIAAGFGIAILASQRAVVDAAALAAGTRIPPFIVGITLLAIGTDLPEIANSIVSSISGHGDINVGDSVGSAVTQATLVVGLLPIVGGAFVAGRRRVARIGGATVGALLLGAFLMSDGFLGRGDAILLIGSWLAGNVLVWRDLPPEAQPSIQVVVGGRLRKGFEVLVALAVVAVGATAAVWGLATVAEALDVSEYLVAFVLASLGTSLPELVVNLTAIRQGQRDLALGGALGASFIDSTLSIAAGPLIAPVAVTAGLVVKGSIAAAATIALVVVLLSVRRRHDRVSGFILVALYFAFYAVVIAVL
jgi:cation:H+ antiporter